MKALIFTLFCAFLFVRPADAQVPINTLISIAKAEDARNYGKPLEDLMRSPNAEVRKRAALAAGRIGDEKAIGVLSTLLASDPSQDIRAMAAFAIGEIESINGSDAILAILDRDRRPAGTDPNVIARAAEAAGKIAAANPKDERSRTLGKAILAVLNFEHEKRSRAFEDIVLLSLTAVLRARPEGGADSVKNFLRMSNPRIVADALNTLTRLRATNAGSEVRELLSTHKDAVVRANAARVLGAAEDKDSFDLLLSAATGDPDLRVRVAAIRSLASLKDARAAERLIARGNDMLIPIHGDPAPLRPGQKVTVLRPIEVSIPKNELLEIAATVGRLFTNTENGAAIAFLTKLRSRDDHSSPETEIALARIAPNAYLTMPRPERSYRDFRVASAYGQGLAAIAELKDDLLTARAGKVLTNFIADMAKAVRPKDQASMLKAMPELTGALAALKPDNLDDILRGQLTNDDVFVRAAAAALIADQPASKENIEALKAASIKARSVDKHDNDAKLAILDALVKLDRKAAVGTILTSLNDDDYLVRKKAFAILSDRALQAEFPGIAASLDLARSQNKQLVLPYSPTAGTKLGQILNRDADYRRAISRKNGSVRAVLTTEKGTFTIVFNPEEAPLTVDNWVRLARSGYFNGLLVHRVVPNFVMQDGDPRGDGNGGPGLSIRCEVNMLGYERGAVGMALSGKDTGGSQWFVTHSPQPHLDGGYTVFGHVDESGMKVVDDIARGDRIISVKVFENRTSAGPRSLPKKQ